MPTQRIRRRPEEARASILHTAEQLLMAGGPPAVQMRAVAARLGMTDAGVAHHFGSRDELLAALLRHGGRRIRDAVTIATEGWLQRGASVQELIDAIYSVYAGGYGELAIALHAAGWREEGVGMLDGVVDALHNLRPVSKGRRPSRGSTRLAVAALHQALATETAYGAAFRRSAGIAEPDASRTTPQLKWWATTIATVLQIADGGLPKNPGDSQRRQSSS
ncbi:TetR/AcrR family transcriptional regulator [Mycolicibacterium poriferae]|uniref:TetR/AcrR family transcriptional regulator n=1 Tax=Mycolicibacterium poriferae TaxID=39694 RepID=UPI0024B93D6D|nr:helix-turn-helix domain-containing protein [Mycolicibacterium poriferae]